MIDEAKELSGDTETTEQETAGEIIDEETPTSEPNQPEETPSEEKVVFAGKEFANIDEANEHFSNREKLYGKQANELGELRQQLEQSKPPEIEPDEDYDPYDRESMENWLQKREEKMAQAISNRVVQQQEFQGTLQKLQKENPDVTPEEWLETAKFADENGIRSIKSAFYVKNRDKEINRAREEGKKSALKELSEAGKISDTLSDKGTGKLDKGKDYDSMSAEEFGSLPEEEQMRALENAPTG